MVTNKNVTVVVDNDSWILPFAESLVKKIQELHFSARLVRSHSAIEAGWCCFFLGCTKIAKNDVLKRNTHNLVVHESDLPKGKGFAPMSWQILGGKNEIPICLFEATGAADSGNIWIKDTIYLNGDELHDEWRDKQGEKTVELCLSFISNYESLQPTPQKGTESFFPRRTPKDSELSLDQTLGEQFSLLRIVDNQKYPAFFVKNGQKYFLRVEKSE